MARDFTELDRQIDNAEAHDLDWNAPGRPWNQSFWVSSCGTYGCIAGNTLLDAGWTITHFGDAHKEGCESMPVEWAAADLLDLSTNEAEAIFETNNTVKVLRRLQKDLHDGRFICEGTALGYQDDEEEE